ncbi:MAG: COMM domain-containing protein [Polyangiaceae bacterium]
MNAPSAPETLPVKLHCLGGREPPLAIVNDLLGLQKMPGGAQERIWEALIHCLGDKAEPESEAALQRFCTAYKVDGDTLALALKGARFFVRQAASRDLSTAVFAEDLMAITSGDEPLSRVLATGYDAAKGPLRAELTRQSLVDHGKVLDRVEWRSDILSASSRGERFRLPYVTMTFSYREGEQQGRVSLQMPRDAVAQLRALCDKILA